VPAHCGYTSYDCQRAVAAARTAGVIGGTASVLSGIKKYSDARIQGQALKELSQSFQSEVAPQVVDVEGRTLRLTGTAEEQYREWRQMLQQLYTEENGGGGVVAASPAAPAIPDAVPAPTVQSLPERTTPDAAPHP